MISVMATADTQARAGMMANMHLDRKTVFVDQLKWDVPVVEERFEVDQFDTDDAVYMVVTDAARQRHLGSVRLLESTRPHILGDIFPELCMGAVPRRPGVWEITRLCISPTVGGLRQGMAVRRQLAVGLAEHALDHGIDQYTLVCDTSHVSQLLAVGWDCEPLGLPVVIGGHSLCAIGIPVTEATLALLRRTCGLDRRVLEFDPQPLPLAA